MPTFRVEYEQIEITKGGLAPGGPPPDPMRKFMAGMPSYFIDDTEVSEEEYIRRINNHGRP